MATGTIQLFRGTLIVTLPTDIPPGLSAVKIPVGTSIGGGKTAPNNMRGYALRDDNVVSVVVQSYDGATVLAFGGTISPVTWYNTPHKITTTDY